MPLNNKQTFKIRLYILEDDMIIKKVVLMSLI